MSYNNGPKIVTNGLVLYLDAANNRSYPGSGTVWNDLSGNRNTGSLVNGPTFNSSNGGSVVFDGTNDYINCGTGLALSGGWTLCAFFRTTASNVAQVILCRTGGAATSYAQNYVIYIDGATNKFTCATSADSYKNIKSNTTSLINTWYYVCGTYDSTSKILSVYVNGILEGSSVALVANPPTTGAQYVTIGASDGLDVGNRLTGNVAQASIYDRLLSASEIRQNYHASKGRFGL